MAVHGNHAHLLIEDAGLLGWWDDKWLVVAQIGRRRCSLKIWSLLRVAPFLHTVCFQWHGLHSLKALSQPESILNKALPIKGELLIILTWVDGLRVIPHHEQPDERQAPTSVLSRLGAG